MVQKIQISGEDCFTDWVLESAPAAKTNHQYSSVLTASGRTEEVFAMIKHLWAVGYIVALA